MWSSLPIFEECEQMNKVFFGQTAIFQNRKRTDYLHFGKCGGFNLRYIWNREEFSSYPLKTVIFTVSKLSAQEREKNIVHLRRGSSSHLHKIRLNFHNQKHIQWYFVYRRTLKQIIVLVHPYNYVMSFCVSWKITCCILTIQICNMHLHDYLNSQKCYKKKSIHFFK